MLYGLPVINTSCCHGPSSATSSCTNLRITATLALATTLSGVRAGCIILLRGQCSVGLYVRKKHFLRKRFWNSEGLLWVATETTAAVTAAEELVHGVAEEAPHCGVETFERVINLRESREKIGEGRGDEMSGAM